MWNNTVEIVDSKGQKLAISIFTTSLVGLFKDTLAGDRVDVTVGLTGSKGGFLTFPKQSPGRWKVIDFGLIRYNAGILLASGEPDASYTTSTIYLINLEKTWGMKLFNFYDFWGVNEAGEGTVPVSWVTGLAQGRFTWSIKH